MENPVGNRQARVRVRSPTRGRRLMRSAGLGRGAPRELNRTTQVGRGGGSAAHPYGPRIFVLQPQEQEPGAMPHFLQPSANAVDWHAPAAASAPLRKENEALAGLPSAVLVALEQFIADRRFGDGAVIWEPGQAVDQIYFPRSGVISIRVPTHPGHAVEVAAIAREGAAGFQDRAGPLSAISQGVAQIGGEFACISKQHFTALAREHAELRWLERVCLDWLLVQARQIAACNTAHSADARFCRWLIRMSDAIADEAIPATQEAIAETLGLRRTTATLIAQRLQAAEAISYRRGRIIIRDRAALEAAACTCCVILGRRNWPSELLRNEVPPQGADGVVARQG